MFNKLHSSDINTKSTQNQFNTLFAVIYGINLILYSHIIIISSSVLSQEGDTTVSLTHRHPRIDLTETFFKQIQHRSWTISTGLFKCNWTIYYLVCLSLKLSLISNILFPQFISGLTDFLVILFQFDSSPAMFKSVIFNIS